MMLYYLITSAKNRRGIVCEECDKDEMLDAYFDGHKYVNVTAIPEDEYLRRVYG